jgi:hypothetical protein
MGVTYPVTDFDGDCDEVTMSDIAGFNPGTSALNEFTAKCTKQ